ncbi:MAG: glycosyltransferase [Gammaproteobacteria bacterium]
MKITFFVSSLGSGGAEKMMLNLAKTAADQGHNVDLLLVRSEGPHLDQVPAEIRPHVLKKTGRLRGLLFVLSAAKKPLRFLMLFRLPRFLTVVKPVSEYLQTRRPDIVISTLHTCNLSSVMARECADVKTRIVVRECIALSSFIQSVPNRKKSLLPFIRLVYPLADYVVSVSKDVQKDLRALVEIPEGKAVSIYNPVIGGDFQARMEEPIDHPWLTGKKDYVVIGVGRLTKQKDFGTLIRAFAKLRRKAPCKLIILGQGREKEALQALVGELGLTDDVDLHGFTHNPYHFMAHADLFVLPSLLEGAPNVLVEAMASGCNVISTDCPGGSAELLDYGRYGKLVPVRDVDALAEAMLDDYRRRPKFEETQAFARTFTRERALSEYLALAPAGGE